MVRLFLLKTGLFLGMCFIGGLITIIINLYFLGNIDPKFKDTPNLAYQTEILGLIAISIIGSVLYLIGISSKFIFILPFEVNNLVISISGLLYFPIIFLFTGFLESLASKESLNFLVFTWILLILYPIILGLISNKSLKPGTSHNDAP